MKIFFIVGYCGSFIGMVNNEQRAIEIVKSYRERGWKRVYYYQP
jgi:hypothetical protein